MVPPQLSMAASPVNWRMSQTEIGSITQWNLIFGNASNPYPIHFIGFSLRNADMNVCFKFISRTSQFNSCPLLGIRRSQHPVLSQESDE